MKYSDKINLGDFFMGIADEVYCVVKLDKAFPSYQAYSDIDVFCYDVKKMVRAVLEFGNNYVEKGFKIQVNELSEHQVHVDFYVPGENRLDFRFDLMQCMGEYEKISVKPALFSSILESRVSVRHNSVDFFVPSPIDDLLIRYIEFVEYYDIRADKIKHADYINDHASKLDKKAMLDKLHFYTKLPLIVSDPDEVNAKFNISKTESKHERNNFSFKKLRRRFIQVRLKKDQKLIKIFGVYLLNKKMD
jgi:hypothetical protein